MALRVAFDLEEQDLRLFRNKMKQAKSTARQVSEEEILQKAEQMLAKVKTRKAPLFVMQRIEQLNALINMVRDEKWALASSERKNVIAALAYFADPQDIIPDDVPVLGYLDDAIMIELVVRELKHEIDAFNDFCRYRDDEKARNRNPDPTKEDYLAMKRRALHSRMRRRRASGSSEPQGTRIQLF